MKNVLVCFGAIVLWTAASTTTSKIAEIEETRANIRATLGARRSMHPLSANMGILLNETLYDQAASPRERTPHPRARLFLVLSENCESCITALRAWKTALNEVRLFESVEARIVATDRIENAVLQAEMRSASEMFSTSSTSRERFSIRTGIQVAPTAVITDAEGWTLAVFLGPPEKTTLDASIMMIRTRLPGVGQVHFATFRNGTWQPILRTELAFSRTSVQEPPY
jgi:hypothetical protein